MGWEVWNGAVMEMQAALFVRMSIASDWAFELSPAACGAVTTQTPVGAVVGAWGH